MCSTDRMWNIRDAILAWLYQEQAALKRTGVVNAPMIQAAVNWSAAEITLDELDRDCEYLVEMEYISGQWAHGSLLLSPRITPKGENLAAQGISVRPGPPREAIITGVTNHHWNINNSGSAQMAINSSNFTQNMTVEAKQKRITQVADALDAFADERPADAERARQVATDLREAADDPEANAGALRTLLTSTVGVVAAGAGTTIGQHVMQLVTAALPMLAPA